MRQIIGMVGAAGSGKNTAANFIINQGGWLETSFAENLYKEVAQAFNVSVEFLSNRKTKESPLKEMALINCSNSEFVSLALGLLSNAPPESFKERIIRFIEKFTGAKAREKRLMHKPLSPRTILQWWGTDYRRVKYSDSYWTDKVVQFIKDNPDKSIVVTDVRYDNEALLIKSLNGEVIQIIRPKNPLAANKLAQKHASEQGISPELISSTLFNEEGEDGLAKLKALIEQLPYLKGPNQILSA